MFNWWKKDEALAADSNRVDELANRLGRERRITDLEAELDKLDRTKLSRSELESWYHLRGVAAFRREDRQLARERFTEGHAKFPKSGMIAFSLGQEHEYAGNTAAMFDLFDRARFPMVPASHALAESRYAYLWGDIERALSYVEPVLEMHYKLAIADDTFLYMRRMPFFSQTWAYIAAFCELKGDLARLAAVTEKAASRLKDYDSSRLKQFVSCMRTGDFSVYAAHPNGGTGYERARAAVILSLRASSLDRAREVLDAVQFAANDFPWLGDMILLARCEATRRFDASAEPGLVESFFLRQPLLFEPDHALNFRAVGYQELLKQPYQSRRRAQSN